MSNKPLRIFLDTEFTDFTEPALISAGFAAESRQTLYFELSEGWQMRQCSAFVCDTVIPLLNTDAGQQCTVEQARVMLAEWLLSFDQPLRLVFDAEVDLELVSPLLPRDRLGAEYLSWPGSAMAYRQQEILESILGENPRRHHALIDAVALMHSVVQTEQEFLRGL